MREGSAPTFLVASDIMYTKELRKLVPGNEYQTGPLQAGKALPRATDLGAAGRRMRALLSNRSTYDFS